MTEPCMCGDPACPHCGGYMGGSEVALETLICLGCGEVVNHCQCLDASNPQPHYIRDASTQTMVLDPLVRWHHCRNELAQLSKSLSRNSSPTIVVRIQALGAEMLAIEGCDPDCDCKTCHDLERNAWDSNYPNVLDQRLQRNMDEIWVVDLCAHDDYRMKDAEVFRDFETAEAYIAALEGHSSGMVANGGPWNITPEKIKTLETAFERLDEVYGGDE